MNAHMTSWLLWMLGVEARASGDDVQWQLVGAWDWRPGMVVLAVLLGLASLAYVGWMYAHERSSASRRLRILLTALRLGVLALVFLVMIFALQLNYSRTTLPYLALVVDESASMAEQDEYDSPLREQLAQRQQRAGVPTTRRLDVVKALLLADDGRLLRELSRRYRVQIYAAAGAIRKLPGDLEAQQAELRQLEAVGNSSRLGSDLRAVLDDLRGTEPAAAVYFGDAITTAGPSLSEIGAYARRKGTPLFLCGIGSDMPSRTIELEDLLVDDVVCVNDPVVFDFKLTTSGLAGQPIELVLKNKKTGDVLDHRQVTAGKNGVSQRVSLSHRPTQVGTFQYVVDVASPREELKNRVEPLSKTVEVRKTRIKVLLVQAYPSYEYRYLKNMLKRDETIELKTVLQDADSENAAQDRTALSVFPVGRDELFKYDVLIFGDVDPSQLSPSVMTNVADFVKVKGGGLMLISGPEFNPVGYRDTPLAALLPFELRSVTEPPADRTINTPVAIHPTPLGLTSPHMQLGDTPAETERIWNNLPEVYWTVDAPELKAGAQVLAEDPNRTGRTGRKLPLMVLEHLPPGKVIWHATDETYRWRFRIGDVLFARYWIQTIRYLARSTLSGEGGPIRLTSDRREYERGAPVQLRVRFFDERLSPRTDEGVTVMLEAEGQERRSLRLDRDAASREIFTATLTDLGDGNYHAWVAAPQSAGPTPAVNFRVLPPRGERTRLDMDLSELRAAAATSDGKYFTLKDVDRLLDELPKGRTVRIESLPPIVLWNNWRVMVLFVGLLLAEWLLRKRAGML